MGGPTRHAAAVPAALIGAAALCTILLFPVHAQPVREPAPGVLLVASGQMGDPRFARSVVLIISHDQTGSWGLIINKPTDIDPGEVLPAVESSDEHASVYFGGPVEVDRLLALYRDGAGEGEGERRSGLPGVHWSDSTETVAERLEQTPGDVRVFAGYAGWGPGQLAFEIAHGGWRLIQGHSENVFSDEPEQLWERLSRALEGIEI